ncbi:LysR family transcriptional regulator [Roseomonas sp. OT10]|uniref:winged helix-turn-helix domain-containing protein n=1 Tax=Roseomonas cutis TaxID=2897332 RepID=UPI001E2A62C8|nr:LysR family transcriptional regulator [Roseomonas sp. OT10]UFN48192.1 LysR family transcriptional regulator [Roseomonas sp. OT10]
MPRRKPSAPGAASQPPHLSIRLDLGGGVRIGPGKVTLLEEIGRSGSIAAAGRALRMSYRRAWELVEDLNRSLGRPVLEATAGGNGGGGARLTALGEAVVREYRAIEAEANAAAATRLARLAGGRQEAGPG